MHWYAFLARLTLSIWEFYRANWWIFICKLRSKRRVFSDYAGMKNISGEVSIFCQWNNWIHLVTCSKIEFREPYYCSRCALDKICEIYSFDCCPHGLSSQKSFLAYGDAKKERIGEQLNYFWNMRPNSFSWAKNLINLVSDGAGSWEDRSKREWLLRALNSTELFQSQCVFSYIKFWFFKSEI